MPMSVHPITTQYKSDLLRTPARSAEPNYPAKMFDPSVVTSAVHVIATESAALANLENVYEKNGGIQQNFARAVAMILQGIENGGKLVVSAVGKSGKIGKKLVATMISMSVPCVFLHPTEALHGDLGILRPVRFLHDTLTKLLTMHPERYNFVCDLLGADQGTSSASPAHSSNSACHRHHISHGRF